MGDELHPRNQIKICAQLVFFKLNEYIEIHNLILEKSHTFRSLIKNFLGIDVPFDEFVVRLKYLEGAFTGIIDAIDSTRDSIENVFSEEELLYIDYLRCYAVSLHKTVSSLLELQEAYYQKSIGKKLKWSTARSLQKRYQQSIADYQENGKKLNDMSYIISE